MIGAVIAMQSEAEILISQMNTKKQETKYGKQCYVGTAFNKDVVVIICGVGKVNAALGVQLAISEYKVDKVLNFGVAGGLDNSTKLCSVYAIEKSIQFDFDLTQLNGTKIGTLDECQENYLTLSTVNGYETRNLGTSDRFNDSKADYELLTSELNANIRDMEGGAIVQGAWKAGLPVYSFKAISDVAGSGSTTEQYLKNRGIALENLKKELKNIFNAL